SRRRGIGRGPSPHWARPESMPRWWTRRSAPRSSTRRTWCGSASRSRPWSKRRSVLDAPKEHRAPLPSPPPEGGRGPDLLPRLSAFARLLHDAGLEAGPRRLTDATRALTFIDLKQERDFRSALRTVFVSRKDDIPTFEAAFDIFWAPPDPLTVAGAMPGRARPLPMSPERAKAWANALGLNSSQMNREQDVHAVPATSSGYSAEELLRHKDFEAMTWEETEQVRRLLEQAPWRVAERRTRRLRAARSGRVALPPPPPPFHSFERRACEPFPPPPQNAPAAARPRVRRQRLDGALLPFADDLC